MPMYMIMSQYSTRIMIHLSYTYCYARREIFNHGKYDGKFNCPFNKYLLNIFYVPGTPLRTVAICINQIVKVPCYSV